MTKLKMQTVLVAALIMTTDKATWEAFEADMADTDCNRICGLFVD